MKNLNTVIPSMRINTCHIWLIIPRVDNLVLVLMVNLIDKFILLLTKANMLLFKIHPHRQILLIIIPQVNSPYKTSIDERLIFYNISRCYSDCEYCNVFAIAAGDIIKYQRGHMMRNADGRTVRSRQETFNSNGGHDAWFCDFKLQITSLFMARNIKCGYSFS